MQKLASIQPRTSLSKFGGKFNSTFIRLLRNFDVGKGAAKAAKEATKAEKKAEEAAAPRARKPTGRAAAMAPAYGFSSLYSNFWLILGKL